MSVESFAHAKGVLELIDYHERRLAERQRSERSQVMSIRPNLGDMSMEFTLFVDGDSTDVHFKIDASTISLLHRFVEVIDQRHGPNRDIGPITFCLENGTTRIEIETQKQDTYVLEEKDLLWEIVDGPRGAEGPLWKVLNP